MDKNLPIIPAKRYFTIGEVGELCDVKPYVLRYWEQEFSQLRPMKRRGNRRYYQHHEVLLIRRIRELLYEEGFTINGARNQLINVEPQKSPASVSDSIAMSLQAALGGKTVVESSALISFETDTPTGVTSLRCGGSSKLEGQAPALGHKINVSRAPASALQHEDWLKSELSVIRDLLII